MDELPAKLDEQVLKALVETLVNDDQFLYELNPLHPYVSYMRVLDASLRQDAIHLIITEGLSAEEVELFRSDLSTQCRVIKRHIEKVEEAIEEEIAKAGLS